MEEEIEIQQMEHGYLYQQLINLKKNKNQI